MTAVLTVAGVDVSAVAVYDCSVSVGRDDIDGQPNASVLDATIYGWRPAGQLGDPVTLTDADGSLFVGTVTDLTAEHDDEQWTVGLTATGPLATLGHIYVGDEPWPEESDSERVDRILTLAGVPDAADPSVAGPAILPKDIDRQPALQAAQSVASDAFGVLWEQPSDPSSPVRYMPARLRAWNPVTPLWSELPPDQSWSELPPGMAWNAWTVGALPGDPGRLDLAGAEVDARGVSWSQQIGDLVRAVRVVWGPAEPEPRPEESLGTGTPEIRLDTQLANQGSAQNLADTIYRTRNEPTWRLTGVRVHKNHVGAARWSQIRAALAIGTRLTIDGIGIDAPTGTGWEGYLEGWIYRLEDGAHSVDLRTSERALTEPADRWSDINATTTWQAIGPAVTWSDLVNVP